MVFTRFQQKSSVLFYTPFNGKPSQLNGRGSYAFIGQALANPPLLLLSLIAVGLVMASISTADTFLIVASHSLTTDVLMTRSRLSLGTLDECQQLLFAQIGRAIVVLSSIAIVGVWFCLWKSNLLHDPLTLFFVAYSVQFCLLPLVIRARGQKPRHPDAAVLALVVAVTVTLMLGFVGMYRLQSADASPILILRPDQAIALLPIIGVGASWIVLFSTTRLFCRRT